MSNENKASKLEISNANRISELEKWKRDLDVMDYEHRFSTHTHNEIAELKEQIKNIWLYLPSDLGEQLKELRNQEDNELRNDTHEVIGNHQQQLNELKERFDFKNEQAYNEHTSIRKHLNKTQEVLRELFQRMGDNEDLSVVGYDLLEKIGSEKKEVESCPWCRDGVNHPTLGVAKMFHPNDFKASDGEKPPEPKICIGCNKNLKGHLEVYMCGGCADNLINHNGILVKREDLQSLANLVKIHYSNDKRIPELNRIKEEYGIE